MSSPALVHSTYGRGFIAVRDDEVAAEAMGINTDQIQSHGVRHRRVFRGHCGRTLRALDKQFITPSGFDFMQSIDIVVMVILGGMGNTIGVILAADVADAAAGISAVRSPEYRMIIYSLLLIILMLTRPQGLFTFGGAKIICA